MRPQAVIAVLVAMLGIAALTFVLLNDAPRSVVEEPTPRSTVSEPAQVPVPPPTPEARRPAAPAGEARIDIRVHEDGGGRVVGCDIELWPADGDATEALARATSAGGGAIRFEGLALGGYVLRVVDSDWVGDDVSITLTDAAGFGQAGVLVSRKP